MKLSIFSNLKKSILTQTYFLYLYSNWLPIKFSLDFQSCPDQIGKVISTWLTDWMQEISSVHSRRFYWLLNSGTFRELGPSVSHDSHWLGICRLCRAVSGRRSDRDWGVQTQTRALASLAQSGAGAGNYNEYNDNNEPLTSPIMVYN